MKNLKTFLAVALFTAATATFAQVQKIENLQVTGGAPGVGKVLTSNATGVATWQDAPGAGAGSGSTVAVTAVSPIHSTTGKVWMDRNLGASRRAQSATDYLAYGQLYQWGRGNDGHADITWTSATAGTPVNGTTTTLSTTDYPEDNLFILQPASPYDWRATQNDNLWQGVVTPTTGVNNPCPAGYRLPTNTELTTEVTAYTITNSASAFASPLKFTVPGYRSYANGTLNDVGSGGNYWSSSVSGTSASNRYFNAGGTNTDNDNRAFGLTVRCLKD